MHACTRVRGEKREEKRSESLLVKAISVTREREKGRNRERGKERDWGGGGERRIRKWKKRV